MVDSEMVQIEGHSICMHTWTKKQNDEGKGDDNNNITNNNLAIIYHGFLVSSLTQKYH